MKEIKATKSIATDEQGNLVDSELVDSNKKANPDSYLKTIQEITQQVLKDNLDLRDLKHRSIVRLLVEEKLGKKVSDETVPRAIRAIQNSMGLFNPEVEDKRKELEQENREFYSK